MEKYLASDFLPNIVIHNTLSICGRMAGWGTWDLRRGLKLSCLVSSRMVLIWQADLGLCMMRARRWACVGAGPIE